MRMTSKGQVTVPRRIREAAGMQPNSEVRFSYEGGVVTLHPVENLDEGQRRVKAFEAHLKHLREHPPKMTMTADELMELTRGE